MASFTVVVFSLARQAPLAQLAEQLTLNQRVHSSSLWRCTQTNRSFGGGFVVSRPGLPGHDSDRCDVFTSPVTW